MAWTLLLLVGVFLARSPRTADPVLLPRFVFVAAMLGIFLLAAAASLLWERGSVDGTVLASPATVLWLGGVLAAGASTLVAVNRSEALFGWARLVLFLVLFVVLGWVVTRNNRTIETLAWLMALICLTLTVTGLVQLAHAVEAHGWTPRITYAVKGPMAHRNLLAQAVALTLPFAALGAVIRRGLARVVSLGTVPLALVLITLLMARSVWVAVVLGFLATLGLWSVAAARRGGQWRRSLGRMLRISAVALLIIVIVLPVLLGHSGRTALLSRLHTLSKPLHGSAGGRIFLWRRSLEMARDHPLLGVGPTNWRIVFPKYAGNREMMRDLWKSPRRPHNDYVWILTERGVVGLAISLALAGLFLWWTVRAILETEDFSTSALAAALFWAQTAYLSFSFFSFPSERIALSVLLTATLAMVYGLRNRLSPGRRDMGHGTVLGLTLLALSLVTASMVLGMIRLRSEAWVKEGYGALSSKHFRRAVRELDQVQLGWYSVDRSGFPIRLYRGVALGALNRNELALQDLRQAVEDSPFNVLALDRLALMLERTGHRSEAIRMWRKALEIHPGYPPAARHLARVMSSGPA
ncbi:MAG: hypothetical protein GXP47_13085 [Acidobacteria bacterium]|nr:hypothetical protein [Acidobacteriota bacterium]